MPTFSFSFVILCWLLLADFDLAAMAGTVKAVVGLAGATLGSLFLVQKLEEIREKKRQDMHERHTKFREDEHRLEGQHGCIG